MPNIFKFITLPHIPSTTNVLKSFFGHMKDNLKIYRGLSYEHRVNFIK